MQEILLLLISFSAVFALGIIAARAWISLRTRAKGDELSPVENAKVRMKTSTALYRCRLISRDHNGWVFTAPMQRDHFVPISVGEQITCEVIANGGLIVFSTIVISRRAIEGSIVVAAPKSVKLQNRRDQTDRKQVDMDVVVAGKNGAVIDLSPGGARVKIQGFEREGNMVRIDLPTGESRGATVVDSKNDHLGSVIRLKFDEPITVSKD